MTVKFASTSFKAQRVLWVLALCGLSSACGGNLRPVPLDGVTSLAGNWQISGEQRDQASAQLQVALKQADDKLLQHERKQGPGGRRENWEIREQHELIKNLIDFAVPPAAFKLLQSTGRIDIVPSVGARRSLAPGESSTLVTTFGSFRIDSGWQEDEFVVTSKDSQDGIVIVERYRKLHDGRLSLALTFSTRQVKPKNFVLTYMSQP